MALSTAIKVDDVGNQGDVGLSDFEVVASYNWLDELQPTILVPGAPPIWSPPSEITNLKPDSGGRYIDQNADRMPRSPLEPLIRSVQTQQPTFDFGNVDLIADRRSVRQLYGFTSGSARPFEFGVETIGETTVFTRLEPSSRETYAPEKFVGFRQSFEAAFTKLHPTVKGSTSHHRILSYNLGGIKILLRSGTDAYRLSGSALPSGHLSSGDEGEEFPKNIKVLTLKRPDFSQPTSLSTEELRIVKGGYEVKQADVLEMATHTKTKPSVLKEKMIDLFLSQTECFVEAKYQIVGARDDLTVMEGRFDDIKLEEMAQRINEWEVEHQMELKKLVQILENINHEARKMAKPCVVRYTGEGQPTISAARDGQVPSLSEELKRLFL